MESEILERLNEIEKKLQSMQPRLVPVVEAARLFNFPRNKLYDLVNQGKAPCIELESLSNDKRKGTTKRKVINTQTFAEWLDNLAKENKSI